MNGPIAQIVALTACGNAFLDGTEISFSLKHSTCQFCDRVDFMTVGETILGRTKEKLIAEVPDDWLSYLQSLKARRIRLWHEPQNDPVFSDRMLAGFGGGGQTWVMEVMLPANRSTHWIARWEVWDQDAPQDRIWRVSYLRVSKTASRPVPVINLAHTTKKLKASIKETHKFSESHGLDRFAQYFEKALDTLESKGKTLHGYHQDILPVGVSSIEAITILDACQSCWLFGGMGSWNDIGFEGNDQKIYEQVSDRLFNTAIEAIVAAANATGADGA